MPPCFSSPPSPSTANSDRNPRDPVTLTVVSGKHALNNDLVLTAKNVFTVYHKTFKVSGNRHFA
jgi:hypothetical protein